MAVEVVIGEPCSAELPKNSVNTGHFLFIGAPTKRTPSENSTTMQYSRVCLIRCNETEQGITGKSREF